MVDIGNKGKYDEWLTPDGLAQVEAYARDGLTDKQIAHNMGVAYSTFRGWLKQFPALLASLKKGKAPVDLQVENALLKRALGYTEEEIITEIIEQPNGTKRKQVRKVQRVYPPDVTAQIFWLKNRKPKQWRDKVENAVSVDTEDLSPLVELLKGE